MGGLLRSCSFVLFSALALPAHAATIYSTFGPGDSYFGSAFVIGNPDLQVAAAFVPAFDATLESIRVATAHLSDVNDYTVFLADDNGGVPGTVIETFSGLTFAEQGTSILTLNSVLMPLLSAGTTYWIAMLSSGGDSYGHWQLADPLTFGPTAGKSVSLNFDWTNPVETSSLPAYEVNGTRQVPEPGALLLMGAGIAVGLRRYARRHRRGTGTF